MTIDHTVRRRSRSFAVGVAWSPIGFPGAASAWVDVEPPGRVVVASLDAMSGALEACPSGGSVLVVTDCAYLLGFMARGNRGRPQSATAAALSRLRVAARERHARRLWVASAVDLMTPRVALDVAGRALATGSPVAEPCGEVRWPYRVVAQYTDGLGTGGRVCPTCGVWKPWGEYYRNRGCVGGREPRCKVCKDANLRDYRATHREQVRAVVKRSRLKVKYGLSEGEYETRTAASAGRCEACGRLSKRLVLDHCHRTGEFRGLLCTQCNTSLGMAGDDPDILMRLAAWLRGIQSGTAAATPTGGTASPRVVGDLVPREWAEKDILRQAIVERTGYPPIAVGTILSSLSRDGQIARRVVCETGANGRPCYSEQYRRVPHERAAPEAPERPKGRRAAAGPDPMEAAGMMVAAPRPA